MFFETWELFEKNNLNSISFYNAFLNRHYISERELLDNNEECIIKICVFLRGMNINFLIDVLDESYISEIKAEDIIQFSSFKAGLEDVPLVLEKEDRDLSFDEVGLLLLGNREAGALKKYGENHSKLAEFFSLVKLSDDRLTKVKLTSLGLFFTKLDFRFKTKILRILALRNPLIKNLIIKAKFGIANYNNETSCLSTSTQIRRRSNVKTIVEFILKDSDYEDFLNNIVW